MALSETLTLSTHSKERFQKGNRTLHEPTVTSHLCVKPLSVIGIDEARTSQRGSPLRSLFRSQRRQLTHHKQP